MRAARGFTLLELIIAIAIFAVISVMAYSGLSNVLETRRALEQQSERINQMQRAFTIIARDLEQVISRGIRDGYGSDVEAMKAESYGDISLEFTRDGWPDPFPVKERPRSNLQRVSYRLEEKKLLRGYWDVLDQAPDSGRYDNPLLSDVVSFKLRFLEVQGDSGRDRKDVWHDKWPVQGVDRPLPDAVEVSLELEGTGAITRLYALPGVKP